MSRVPDNILELIKDELDKLSDAKYEQLKEEWAFFVDVFADGGENQLDASEENSELPQFLEAIRLLANTPDSVGERVRFTTGSTIAGALADAVAQRYSEDPLSEAQQAQLVSYMTAQSQRIWETTIDPLLDQIEAESGLF
jgi:hypothetical protein